MILGITGSFGAGKGAVVEYLSKKGFNHYSASGFLAEEIVRRNMPLNRDSMTVVANDLRATHGPSYIIDSLYMRAQEKGGNAIIESLRAVAEVRRIRELGGVVLGVDAPAELRYQRTRSRQSEKDDVTYEKWLAQEQAEMNPDDPTKQDIFGALAESDAVIQNEGTMEELHEKVEQFLRDYSSDELLTV